MDPPGRGPWKRVLGVEGCRAASSDC
jgi:hypothetical protein